MSDAANGRRQARIATEMRIFEAAEPEAGPWVTRDLSAAGLFLLVTGRWAAGDEVSLILEHGEARLRVRARATQVTAEGTGFELLHPPPELEAAVLEMMSERFAAGDELADRRREARWTIDLPVVWRAAEAGEFRARARDLSPEGAGLVSAVKPSAGTIVYLLLPLIDPIGTALPYRAMMGTRGRVAEPTVDGFGVEFVAPSESFAANVLRLLARG